LKYVGGRLERKEVAIQWSRAVVERRSDKRKKVRAFQEINI